MSNVLQLDNWWLIAAVAVIFVIVHASKLFRLYLIMID